MTDDHVLTATANESFKYPKKAYNLLDPRSSKFQIPILFDSDLRSSQACEQESNASILYLIPSDPRWGIRAQFARCLQYEYYNMHSKLLPAKRCAVKMIRLHLL